MKRVFNLDGFEIVTYTNLRTRLTEVTIKKNNVILLNEKFQKAPFAIDYAELIENL